ncbi:MAG TPA: response regulator transcription factor [Chitinophagaceae bacterium]|nr:response regulator transcription factor [Chitinophagaceae bacterium]
MKKTTIIVVDDHKMIREMWANVFGWNPEMEVVGESGEFNEAIALIKEKQPDIVLLDINLREASGIDAIPLIKCSSPHTHVIGVSMHSQPAIAQRMMKAGAKGYVTKNSAYDEIFQAIQEVMKGGTYICTEIQNIISEKSHDEQNPKPSLEDLSIREMEVVRLINQGLSSKEIAEELKVSSKTVEVHRYNILKKLNLKNTAALVNFVKTEDPLL